MQTIAILRQRALQLAAVLSLVALLGCQATANLPKNDEPEKPTEIAGAGWWITADGRRLHSTDGTTADTGYFEQPEGWYYLNPADGSVAYGLFEANGRVYYSDLETGLILTDGGSSAGDAETGPTKAVAVDDEVTLNDDGRLVFKDGGLHEIGDNTYYATEDGIEYRGWKVDGDGTRRWFSITTGIMATGITTIDGQAYVFDDDGALRYISEDEHLDRIVSGIVRDVCKDDLRAAYDYVAHSFKYDKRDVAPTYKDWEEDYAIKLYDEGEGNCYSFSCLFCFIARAMGYDCKTIDGLVSIRWDEEHTLYSHSWVEMYGLADEPLICDPVLENGTTDIPSYLITYEDNANATGKYVYEV